MKAARLVRNSIFLIISSSLIHSCAPSRYVKPLANKQKALAFSFGGPLIQFSGAPIPIPFTTLGFGYGLNENVTLHSSLHTTSALFGNAQLDLGTTFHICKKESVFGISASPALQLAYSVRNMNSFRIWPSTDLSAYYHIKNKASFVYAGINSWFELSAKRAHDEPQKKHALPNLQAGYTIVHTKWQHQFELKYLGIGIPVLPGVVDYVGLSGKGAFGIYYSLVRKF